MTKPRIVLSLCLLVTLLVGVFIFRTRTQSSLDLTMFRSASHLEIAIENVPVSLNKKDNTWFVENFDGHAVKDTRANQNFIAHLIDLVQSIRTNEAPQHAASEASQYGLAPPRLAFAFAWTTPEPGSDVVLFGNRNLSGANAFAFFPKHSLLLEVRAHILDLIDGKTALDIRDRRITTFEVDDVEDVVTSDGCGAYSLWRDGDRWAWKSASKPNVSVEQWLAQLLGTRYEQIDEQANASAATRRTLCTVDLKGRATRAETVEVYTMGSDDTLWATNSQLPAAYRLPPEYAAVIGLKTKLKSVKKAAHQK